MLSPKFILSVGTLNVRTLAKQGKIDLVLNELNRYKWDIVGLSETHLPSTGEERIGNTSLIVSGRTDGVHRQGVGFLMSTKARRSLISVTPVSERLIMIRMKGSPINITIIQVYAPDCSKPDEESDNFYLQLQSLIDAVPKKDLIVVIGDFNAIVGNDSARNEDVMGKFGLGRLNKRGERLIEFCRDSDLAITNTLFKHRERRKATWTSPDGKTRNLIDYVLVSRRWKSSVLDTVTLAGGDFDSDHSLVMSALKIRLKSSAKLNNRPARFNTHLLKDPQIRQTYIDELSTQISDLLSNIPVTLSKEDIDKLVTDSSKIISKVAMSALGTKKGDKKPWITNEIILLCAEKRKHNNRSDRESRDRYKQLKRAVEKATRRAHRTYIKDKCEQCEADFKRGDSYFMYKRVRELTSKKSLSSCTLLDKNGSQIQSTEGIRSRWMEHFKEKLNPDIFPNSAVLDLLPVTVSDPSPPPLRSEVEDAIQALKTNKAPGPDGIQAELLKVRCEPLIDLFHKIVSGAWQKSHFPTSWCEATIVPLHKKGSKAICDNYRPISLTSQTAKIFTRIILQRIRAVSSLVIQEYQAGFRPGRSTVDQIFTVRQILEKYLEFGRGLYQLFIDFRQAFDLIWRNGLWHILLHYGIPRNLVDLIKDMYSKFGSRVMTSEGLTDSFQTSAGVLQGCLLSPELFNLFLTAVLSLVETTCGAHIGGVQIDKLAYADDIDEMAETPEDLQAVANDVFEATSSFGMIINVSKTKAMCCSRKPQDTVKPDLKINGESIQWVDEFPYLGSLITSDNSLSKDIKRRLALASSSFKALMPIWRSKDLSLRLKTRLFDTLIIPIAIYSCETWTLKVDDNRRLAAFETKCLRRIAGITYLDRISNFELLERLKVQQTILMKIQLQQLRWLGHVQRMSRSRLPKITFEGQIHGSRPRGRPPKRWKENFAPHRLSDLLRLAEDREAYRRHIHAVTKKEAPRRPSRTDGT